MHVRKKGQVCFYVSPLKINKHGGEVGKGKKKPNQHLSTTQIVFRGSDCGKMIATYCITQKMDVYACGFGQLKNDILNIF